MSSCVGVIVVQMKRSKVIRGQLFKNTEVKVWEIAMATIPHVYDGLLSRR